MGNPPHRSISKTMEQPNYKEFIDSCPEVEKVVDEQMWDYISRCDAFTRNTMDEVWKRNAKKNLKKLYPKHKSLTHSFLGFGKDKALIGVGAGPSLNNNINHLEKLYHFNSRFSLKDQYFIIATCNHQFKPLLNRGIFPHFVFLTDGGSHIYDQLCKDIPKLGQSSILVANIYGDHKTLRDWAAQGRHICFTLPMGEDYQKIFKDITGEDPTPFAVGSGGNVLNTMFSTGIKILHSNRFIALGNDLSYPYDPNIDNRRKTFYADGDYSVNIKKGVDEAKDRYVWLGFRMRDNPFQEGKKIIDLEPMSTSKQMFMYKIWVEIHAVSWANQTDERFIYYNCSESGITGMMAKDKSSPKILEDPDNWYLMDDVIPKRWRTRSFLQAVNQFLEANLICREKDAGVIISPGRTDSVLSVGQNHQVIR